MKPLFFEGALYKKIRTLEDGQVVIQKINSTQIKIVSPKKLTNK